MKFDSARFASIRAGRQGATPASCELDRLTEITGSFGNCEVSDEQRRLAASTREDIELADSAKKPEKVQIAVPAAPVKKPTQILAEAAAQQEADELGAMERNFATIQPKPAEEPEFSPEQRAAIRARFANFKKGI